MTEPQDCFDLPCPSCNLPEPECECAEMDEESVAKAMRCPEGHCDETDPALIAECGCQNYMDEREEAYERARPLFDAYEEETGRDVS